MRERFAARIAQLITRLADGGRDDDALAALLAELAAWQAKRIAPYGRVIDARPTGAPSPGLPTEVFRHARVAGHPPSRDIRTFRTSGTTSGLRGEHALCDLGLYDLAARTAARFALFPDVERLHLVMLAPHPDEAPDSSLSYMLGRFEAWFGTRTDWVFPVDDRLTSVLAGAVEPVALLGTSFAFVHAEDQLHRTFELPAGSRVMQTGGFKGRSREVAPEVLRAAISARYGVPVERVIAEYSMTELSSQMYETTLRGDPHRRLWVPGWVRAQVVDPETLVEVGEGEIGILRLDDAANLDSVCAIQTSDLAMLVGQTIQLLGRAAGAVARGCSLAVEEALESESGADADADADVSRGPT